MGLGPPKTIPTALAARIQAEHAAGHPLRVRVWTSASTGPGLVGALANADGIEFRLPYNSDPVAHEKIRRGEMEYCGVSNTVANDIAALAVKGRADVSAAPSPRRRRAFG